MGFFRSVGKIGAMGVNGVRLINGGGGAEWRRNMMAYEAWADEWEGSDNTHESGTNMAQAAEDGDWGRFANEFVSRQKLSQLMIKAGVPKEVADQIGDVFAGIFQKFFDGILGDGNREFREEAERLNHFGANDVTKDQVKQANQFIQEGSVQADPDIVKMIQGNPEYAGVNAQDVALKYAAYKKAGADVTIDSIVKSEQEKAKAADLKANGPEEKQYENLGFTQKQLQEQGINATEAQLEAANGWANYAIQPDKKDVEYLRSKGITNPEEVAKTYMALQYAGVENLTLDQVAAAELQKTQDKMQSYTDMENQRGHGNANAVQSGQTQGASTVVSETGQAAGTAATIATGGEAAIPGAIAQEAASIGGSLVNQGASVSVTGGIDSGNSIGNSMDTGASLDASGVTGGQTTSSLDLKSIGNIPVVNNLFGKMLKGLTPAG